MLRWLSRDSFPVLPVIPHHCLTITRRDKGEMLVGLANLGADMIDQVQLNVPADSVPRSIRVLESDGTWRTEDFSIESIEKSAEMSKITLRCQIQPFGWQVVLLQTDE